MIMLVLAVVCGLGAMYGTSQLLSKDRNKRPVKEEMLVAVRALKIDEPLKPELFKTVSVPKENVPVGSFKAHKDLVDRLVQIPILADEPVIEAKLAPKGTTAGLVSRIPKGMRAFAIDINETTGVSGFVLPGNRIDIIQGKPSPGHSQAELVLQNVLVLAAGQMFTRPEDKSILARTITLAVTPEQVETLVAARVKGPLTLSLRGVNDTEIVNRTPVPEPPPPPPPPPPPEPAPEIIKVSQRQLAQQDDPAMQPRRKRIVIFRGIHNVEVLQLARPGEFDYESKEDAEPASQQAQAP
jgi:pilus assembly protein CpaB